MGFDDILKKGQEALGGKDGKVDYGELQKEAKGAYDTFNKTEGSTTDKAKAAYGEFNKEHSSASGSSELSEKK